MITGRGGGSGKYSYRETHANGYSVTVSHMPDELIGHEIRIRFRLRSDEIYPLVTLSESAAQLLWCSLSAMADDLGWENKTMLEKASELKK